MRRTLLITLLIALATIVDSYAQHANIVLKTGSQFEGEIDLSTLKDEGVLVVVSGTRPGTYTPDLVQSVLMDDGESIQVKMIRVLNQDYSEDETEYFVKSLILGPASLWEVFGADFQFAAEKESEVKALQVLEVETPLGEQKDDAYKGVLFQLFSDCIDGVNTSSIKNSKSQLIDVFNRYNSCVNPSYEIQALSELKTRIIEFDLQLGTYNSDLNFKRLSFPGGTIERHPNFEYETSIQTYYGVSLLTNIFRENIFLGAGVHFNEYEFSPVINEKVASGTEVEFSEFIFKTILDFEYPINRLKPSLRIGFNVHSIHNDFDGRIFFREVLRTDPLVTSNVFVKRDSELEPSYITYSISPMTSYEVSDLLDIGFSYSFITENTNFLSMEMEDFEDTLTHSSFGVHIILKSKVLR